MKATRFTDAQPYTLPLSFHALQMSSVLRASSRPDETIAKEECRYASILLRAFIILIIARICYEGVYRRAN